MTLLGALAPAGCGTPPSVGPLMRSAKKTLQRERELLAADQSRREQRFEEQLASLKAGYEADLEDRDQIDAQWVMQGTEAYVTAREALLRQRMELKQQTEIRRRNLMLAAESLERATGLIRQQNRLLGPANPWALLEQQSVPDVGTPGDDPNDEEK